MLLAKISPVFMLMMVVMFVALGVGILVFGLPVRGALWMFAVAGACAALAGIGIGVLVATVSKSQQQAQLLTFFVNPPITLLSGATPRSRTCRTSFRSCRISIRCGYLVTIVRGVTLKNAPWSALWPKLVILSRICRRVCSQSAHGGSGNNSDNYEESSKMSATPGSLR